MYPVLSYMFVSKKEKFIHTHAVWHADYFLNTQRRGLEKHSVDGDTRFCSSAIFFDFILYVQLTL